MTAKLIQLVSSLTAPTPPERVTFSGTYDMTIVAGFMDADVLSRALPSGLELRSDDQTPAGKHPLIATFGSQHGVNASGTPGTLNYAESVIGIANVGIRGDSQRVAIHMPRLDVNDPVAAMLGLLVGYQKTLSIISASAQAFSVEVPLVRVPILNLDTTPTTDWKTTADFPDFRYVRGLMKAPLVSVDITGQPIFTVFDWGFDTAKFQGAKAKLAVFTDLPGLSRGNYLWDGFEAVPMGAARVVVPWSLTGPFFDWP